MAEHKYSFEKYNSDTMSRAVGVGQPVSTKHCIEICNHIRGKKLVVAKRLLREAVNKERPIPFRKFNGDVGHKKGPYSAARYPVKAASHILKLVESCEANAQDKALNTEDMVIVHTNAHRGSQQFRQGRQRRRLMKRTTVEVVLEELSKKEKPKKTTKKSTKKAAATKEQDTKADEKGQQKGEEKKAETKPDTTEPSQKPKAGAKATKQTANGPAKNKASEKKSESKKSTESKNKSDEKTDGTK